jgi:hypothetical protein
MPPSQWVLGALSLGMKNGWSCTSIHSPSTHSWRGSQLRHRDQRYLVTVLWSSLIIHESFRRLPLRSHNVKLKYEGVSKSFRTGRLERELEMVQLSATRCSCVAILWVSAVTFAAIILCVASRRVIPKISVYFVIVSARKLLDTHSYFKIHCLF